MGVIYKLKEDLIEKVLTEKKLSPQLSCRALTKIFHDKYGIKISKSSANALFKNAGFSMPVGRPSKKRKAPYTKQELRNAVGRALSGTTLAKPVVVEAPVVIPPEKQVISEKSVLPNNKKPTEAFGNGAVLLKAADLLIGGGEAIIERLKQDKVKIDRLSFDKMLLKDFSPEAWVFMFDTEGDISNQIETNIEISVDLSERVANLFKPLRGLKFSLDNNKDIYFDPQLLSVWQKKETFKSIWSNLSVCEYLKYQIENGFVIPIFLSPVQEDPSEELYELLEIFSSGDRKVKGITFSVGDNEKNVCQPLTHYALHIAIGLLPAQYSAYRRINVISNFMPITFNSDELWWATAEVEILQISRNRRFTVKAIALKHHPDEKISFLILSNKLGSNPVDIIFSYLNRWPTLEAGLDNYLHQVEIEMNPADVSGEVSYKLGGQSKSSDNKIESLISSYLIDIDEFIRYAFFPQSFQKLSFDQMKSFYGLETTILETEKLLTINFNLPVDFSFTKELRFACQRINEQALMSFSGKRIVFHSPLV